MEEIDFHGLIPIGSLDSKCPNCGHPFKTRPKSKRVCGNCLRPVYVRERPLDMQKVLLREEDLGTWMHQKAIFFGGLRSVDDEKDNFDKFEVVSADARLINGGVFPPYFLENEHAALIIEFLKSPGESISKGDPLVKIQTPARQIKVLSPIDGVISHLNTEPAKFVREHNQLLKINQFSHACKVKTSIVNVGSAEQCIRIDYISGVSVLAREWVSPFLFGVKGKKSRSWCMERFGYIPENLNDLAYMISEMPPIENIDLMIEGNITKIHRIKFCSMLKSKAIELTDLNTVIIEEADRLELENELKSIRLDVESNQNKIMIPVWWRLAWSDYKQANFTKLDGIGDYLKIIRKSYEDGRVLPSISYAQVITAIGMAYSIGLPPKASELHILLPQAWTGDPFVFKDHIDALYKKITDKIDIEWAERAFGPLESLPIDKVRSGLSWYSDNYWFEQESISIRSVRNVIASESFRNELKRLFYDCSNEVRVDFGLPRIGEGWVSETALYQRVKNLLPNYEVIQHSSPDWLGRQHFDVWIPKLNIAIEYQGIQHYQPVEIFGGEETFAMNQERDSLKRALCKKNAVRLIEIRYDNALTDEELLSLIEGPG